MWNPFAVKVKRADAMVYIAQESQPRRDYRYKDYAKDAYLGNAVAGVCTRLIAQSVANLPIKIYRKKSDGTEEWIDEHPLWNLLDRPTPGQTRRRWHDEYWGHLYMSGNVYICPAVVGNDPVALWLLRPDRVEIKMGIDGRISGYEYSVEGKIKKYAPEEILHVKFFNPLNDFYGASPLQCVATAIDQDNEAALWNVSLLKNGAKPDIFLKVNGEKRLTPTQKKELLDDYEKRHAGSKNAGRPMILDAVDVKEIGWSPKDIDWRGGRTQAEMLIALAFGVPPEMIGIQAQKTYSNYQEARRAFYKETVIPLADDFYRDITEFFGSRFSTGRRGGDPVIIAVDKDRVEELRESVDAFHMRIRSDVETGVISINEGREEIGYKPVDGGDKILINTSKAPLEMMAGAGGMNGGEVFPADPTGGEEP